MTTLKDKLVTIHPLHQQEPQHSSNEIGNESISHLFAKLIENTGESLHREGLQKTPIRAAKAFQSLTSGYQVDLKKLVNGALFECSNKEMVIVKNIEFFSLCEHHLLPMIGRCHVAYAPNGKILGLSKVGRIVDMFAKRLQIQEKLTQQIAEAIMEVTNAEGVAVMTNAVHLCMMARGIAKQHASVDAISMLGSFKDDINLKHHFIRLAHDLNMAPRQPIIF